MSQHNGTTRPPAPAPPQGTAEDWRTHALSTAIRDGARIIADALLVVAKALSQQSQK